MDKMISDLTNYLATNGSLSDAVAFSQLVGASAWGAIAKLAHVLLGNV